MSISQTSNTIHKLTNPSEEISKIYTAYSPKLKLSLDFDPDLDKTKQEFKDECDINSLMERYKHPELIDFVNKYSPTYGDATGFEFNEMQDQILGAKNMFADLPAKVRDRFNNDPARFLDFFNDPENAQEAAKMGLLAPKPVEVIPDPTPEPVKAPKGSKEPAPKDD